jgi:hypothetical protein
MINQKGSVEMKSIFSSLLMCIVAIGLLTSPTYSQTGVTIGTDFVYPTSDFGDVAGGGFGINIGFTHPLNDNSEFVGKLGFNAYGGLKLTVGSSTAEIQWYGAPVVAGVRFFPSETFFVQGLGGLIYKSGEVKDNLGNKIEESETGWLVSPGAGVKFGKFGVLAEYNVSNDSWQWFGLSAFYQFGGSDN